MMYSLDRSNYNQYVVVGGERRKGGEFTDGGKCDEASCRATKAPRPGPTYQRTNFTFFVSDMERVKFILI